MFYDFLKNITLRLAKFDDFTEFNTQKYIPDRQQYVPFSKIAKICFITPPYRLYTYSSMD